MPLPYYSCAHMAMHAWAHSHTIIHAPTTEPSLPLMHLLLHEQVWLVFGWRTLS